MPRLPQDLRDQPFSIACQVCRRQIKTTVGGALDAKQTPLLCPNCGATFDPDKAGTVLRAEVDAEMARRAKIFKLLKK